MELIISCHLTFPSVGTASLNNLNSMGYSPIAWKKGDK